MIQGGNSMQKKQEKPAEMYHVYNLIDEAIHEEIKGAGYSYDQTSGIIVILEDSGYAFHYIRYILKHLFPYLRIYLIQACGYKGFRATAEYVVQNAQTMQSIHKAIMIYDSGNIVFNSQGTGNNAMSNIIDCQDILESHYKDVQIISWKCFEEAIIQIKDLDKLINRPINDSIYDMYKKMYTDDNWIGMFNDVQNYSDEQLLEIQIQQITKNQTYKIQHSDGKMAGCWKRECIINDMCNPKYCKDAFSECKYKYIARNQLMYLLVRTIEKQVGHKIYNNKYMNQLMVKNDYVQQMYGGLK